MYTESQLNPQFLAKHHGNRQHYMTASRTPPSHREDSHENLRSPLGSCNAHATTLAEPSSMRWAATTQEDLRCRRAAPRRPSGAATAQPRAADRRAALLRPLRPSRGGARRAAQKPKAGPKTRKGPQGMLPLRASLGACCARAAYRKAPSASATPCPPAASRCSTLGEGGLNCRVRDGTG